MSSDSTTSEVVEETEEEYDPADYTVGDVLKYVEDNPDLREDVLAAEKAGKNRSTLVAALQAAGEAADEEGEEVADEDADPEVAQTATKKGRVKGTWHFVYGPYEFDFVDGETYTLPAEVHHYLKGAGNIYDTAK
jgi:hypothetical protein